MAFAVRILLMWHLLTTSRCAKVKVAVYEHAVISPKEPDKIIARDKAFEWMSKNLAIFREQARLAAQQNAKMIVFPEYGITGFDHSRDSIVSFLESVPDKDANWNPCDDPIRFPDTDVLHELSCISKTFSIYIVANMGDIEMCKKNHKNCPKDGRMQFNTNVVFDNNGKLIARYRKVNLYEEQFIFNTPSEVAFVYFQTPFGKFGTIVCFDLLHSQPTQQLLERHKIKNLIVTSAWNVMLPFIISLQMYSGLAKRNNINVIAANIKNEKYHYAGSGIFGYNVSVMTDSNFSKIEGKLLVAEIETEGTEKFQVSNTLPITEVTRVGQPQTQSYHGKYDFGMNMSFSVLSNVSQFAFSCFQNVCCALEYQFKQQDHNEVFVLTASQFYMEKPGFLHMQFCAIHKCATLKLDSCGKSVYKANTTFTSIKLQAFLNTNLLFPFVSTSPHENLTYDMEMENYQFDRDRAILQSDTLENPLLAAVIFNSLPINVNAQALFGASSEASGAYISSFLTLITFTIVCDTIAFVSLN